MEAPALMHKLMEIERALGQLDPCAIRNLILEAQDGVLALERENQHLALQNLGLRRSLEAVRHNAFSIVAQPQAAASDSVESSESADAPLPGVWRFTHYFFT